MSRWLLLPLRLLDRVYVRWWMRSARRVKQEGDL